MLKVLFVASEAAPFAKTGGLGDVTSSLPKELRRQGIDARVIIPKYDSMPEEWKAKLSPQAVFQVSLSWRQHYCGIENLDFDGVPFYFVDNEYYFKRSGLYGHYDDAERFSFFLPGSTNYEGKLLRLKQQYFLVSASLQSIIREYRLHHSTLSELSDKIAIHINDTHPALAT